MLKDTQRKFIDAVMHEKSEEFLSEIEEGGKIGPEKRLQIYAHAYKSRLVEVLVDDFPGLHSLVDDDMFEEICLGYIEKYPSMHPSLRYLGEHMVGFLQANQKYNTIIPAIEMAKFEWAFNDVFDAPDDKTITVEDVAAVPPEAWTTLRIKLQSSYVMQTFKWNVPAVWSTMKEEKPVMPQEYPIMTNCIQWKSDLKCFFRTVNDEEAEVLRLVHQEKAFPDICEHLATYYDEQAPMRAAELFRGWVMEGLVTELEYLKS